MCVLMLYQVSLHNRTNFYGNQARLQVAVCKIVVLLGKHRACTGFLHYCVSVLPG
jgi:hypothetical protein